MVASTRLKISGQTPNIRKIISNFAVYEYKTTKENDSVILDVTMPSQDGINTLILRLSPKRNRRNTKIEIISAKSGELE